MPAITVPSPAALRVSGGTAASTIGSFTMSPSKLAGMKFIAGEPMKPATKMFAGFS